jgi:hypothetical protein
MTWRLPALAVASAIMLAGCDPPPKVEIVNGADTAVSITHVPRLTTIFHGSDDDAGVRIAPGSTGRFILPWTWTTGEVQPSVEFKGCEYHYQLPRVGQCFGCPALEWGIGQWSGLQFESDGSLYARERRPTGVATLAALSRGQPSGWPVRPARMICRPGG